MYLIKHTANDEEPDCMCCDHVCGDGKACKYCGPDHWWARYERTERIKEVE